MNPEEIIAAFLNVWQTNPKNIFETSGAIDSLDKLNEIVQAHKDDSNEVFAEKLGEWCAEYPKLTDAVVATGKCKKFDPEKSTPTQQEENRTLDNRHPQISEVLRGKLPQESEKVKPNSGET